MSAIDLAETDDGTQLTDSDLIKGYGLDQKRRGLEPVTISQRKTKLHFFAAWLGSRSLLEVTEEDIQRFLDGRRGRNTDDIAPRTRYSWLSLLHNFYVWAIKAGHTDRDPTLTIDRPRLRRLLPRPIHDADLQLALELAPRRQRAMLLLAAFEGFRAKEVAAFNREDVLDTYRQPMLLVHGKGGTDDTVPLHPDVEAALKALPLPKHGPVFVNAKTGRRMTPGQVSQEMNTYLDGLGTDATFHQLRHWFGTHIQEAVGDSRVTQELMRHRSPDSTAGYTAFSKEKAAEAVNQLAVNPRVNDGSGETVTPSA